jgi:hypothetical protein
MSIRTLAVAPALAALVLAPISAQAREGGGAAKMAEKMRDPANQAAMAAAIRALSEALLDIPLEPFARVAEAMGDRRTADEMHGATVRDMAGPRAERMPEEMSRKLPAMMGAMGGMAQAAEEMAPALKGIAKEMGARMKDAMRGVDDTADRPIDNTPPPEAQDEGDAPN